MNLIVSLKRNHINQPNPERYFNLGLFLKSGLIREDLMS